MAMFNRRSPENWQMHVASSRISKMAAAGALMAGVAVAPAAMADWYFGINAGPMMIDHDGVDDPTNAGVLIGKEWGVVAGDIGVQAEFTTTVDDGSYGVYPVSVDTQAIYGALRTTGPVYVIAKAGLLRLEVEVDSLSRSDSGLAGGVGIGFSLGVVQFEVEYTLVGEDVSYLSLGVRF